MILSLYIVSLAVAVYGLFELSRFMKKDKEQADDVIKSMEDREEFHKREIRRMNGL